ncbi:MAG TPA: uL13 family ribosomal protein, partial [bacterium]|nr:uL13 family ribosomal protein [bacterium]
MKTTYPKKNDSGQYYILDAENEVLGRLAVKAAMVIRGKHKPTYHPAVDTGDFVIVINADK